jgi:pSer/pThr/pTyr-binding forkhead associated (FHA) protein
MKRPLASYARELILEGDKTLKEIDCPVLLWEAGDRMSEEESGESVITASEAEQLTPRPGNPIVLLLKAEATLSKVTGVSVGRSESNDVVIDNASVSRFHALIHHDTRTEEWKITDAGSRNGTMLDGVKVGREQTVSLTDGCRLKLGDAQLRFLLPRSFHQFLDTRLEGSRRDAARK